MSKWTPGARAVIAVTNHPHNQNRVVTLIQRLECVYDVVTWHVEDGKLFRGYVQGMAHSIPISDRKYVDSEALIIEQWKLRLLEDGEDTIMRDEIEYLEMV
jgi:hypothetical protein